MSTHTHSGACTHTHTHTHARTHAHSHTLVSWSAVLWQANRVHATIYKQLTIHISILYTPLNANKSMVTTASITLYRPHIHMNAILLLRGGRPCCSKLFPGKWSTVPTETLQTLVYKEETRHKDTLTHSCAGGGYMRTGQLLIATSTDLSVPEGDKGVSRMLILSHHQSPKKNQ